MCLSASCSVRASSSLQGRAPYFILEAGAHLPGQPGDAVLGHLICAVVIGKRRAQGDDGAGKGAANLPCPQAAPQAAGEAQGRFSSRTVRSPQALRTLWAQLKPCLCRLSARSALSFPYLHLVLLRLHELLTRHSSA
jgi:hypothetical protein